MGSFISTGFDAGAIFKELTKIITPIISEKIKSTVQIGLFLNIVEISI
ncbi:MAG: hypothetical protein O3B93_05310 [Proteobacteria bacterium]|nr:hypothetical protein [Pseudomonadota bacterium]MDA0972073.1 hypothetical protein [Pseudomonadota bacterium]